MTGDESLFMQLSSDVYMMREGSSYPSTMT